MQSHADKKDAEVNQSSVEDFFSALLNVWNVPFVSELVVAQRPTEYVLYYAMPTIMKQVKKEYTITTRRTTFLLLVCIIINYLLNYTYITITTSL